MFIYSIFIFFIVSASIIPETTVMWKQLKRTKKEKVMFILILFYMFDKVYKTNFKDGE